VSTLNGTPFASDRNLVVEQAKPMEPRPERPARAPATGADGERAVHKDRVVVRNLPHEFDAEAVRNVFSRAF